MTEKEDGVPVIKRIEIDALVVLQIMKHCRQHSPSQVNGQLLGLDVDDVLQVTHSFGYVQKDATDDRTQDGDGEQYQLDMTRLLRQVNVDSNTVGWYQTTHLGQIYKPEYLESQHGFQMTIPASILLVYDELQAMVGKPSFKALRLTPQFMKRHNEAMETGKPAAFTDFPSNEMFMEIPISIVSPVICEAFLVDWALLDPVSTTQIDALDIDNQAFLERNLALLIGALNELDEEQKKMAQYERQVSGRGGQEKGGKGRYKQQAQQPRQLDTMILSQQIQNYCKQINDFSGDSFSKLFLLSNKPTSVRAK
mmetsp:Transcript_138540/g.254178  ORF Transcript_138540/g.254178 Transcript_138540/m.254178 type:complete len:309 (-) Transcript_138540:148-1074(-)